MRCLIFSGHIEQIERISLDFSSYDMLLAADAGTEAAEYFHVRLDAAVGDFDSGPMPDLADRTILPRKKNMTDGEAAIDLAVSRGADEITLLGGLGGRFDHTMGNIGVLAKYAARGISVFVIDGCNRLQIASPGTYRIPKGGYRYLGFASWGDCVTGLTVRGTSWPLTDYSLTNLTSYCVSNEIAEQEAVVTFDSGLLLIMQSNDAAPSD